MAKVSQLIKQHPGFWQYLRDQQIKAGTAAKYLSLVHAFLKVGVDHTDDQSIEDHLAQFSPSTFSQRWTAIKHYQRFRGAVTEQAESFGGDDFVAWLRANAPRHGGMSTTTATRYMRRAAVMLNTLQQYPNRTITEVINSYVDTAGYTVAWKRFCLWLDSLDTPPVVLRPGWRFPEPWEGKPPTHPRVITAIRYLADKCGWGYQRLAELKWTEIEESPKGHGKFIRIRRGEVGMAGIGYLPKNAEEMLDVLWEYGCPMSEFSPVVPKTSNGEASLTGTALKKLVDHAGEF